MVVVMLTVQLDSGIFRENEDANQNSGTEIIPTCKLVAN